MVSIFYFTSKHYITMKNDLFNDEVNTFYYDYTGTRHIVKNHIDRETGNPLPPIRGLIFSVDSNGPFICIVS